MMRQSYTSDLSDDQWALLAPMIPATKPGGRPRKYEMREVLDAIFYITRSGGAWRLLPHDFPRWKTVYHYFRRFRRTGVWTRLHRRLRRARAQASGA